MSKTDKEYLQQEPNDRLTRWQWVKLIAACLIALA